MLNELQLHEQNPGTEGGYTGKQRGTYVCSFTSVLYHLFFSKFVRLHGVLSFQNKRMCQGIYGSQFESLLSHLQVRMDEAEIGIFSFKVAT